MDPVQISETINTSSTVNNATELEDHCTPLDELDLADTFTGMDIGNSEFWGSMSGFWRPCFIIYCILFYAALLILCGICVGLLYYTLKQAAEAAYSLRTVVYLLTLYIIWSTLSLAHGILMIISTAGSNDSGLAHGEIILDTITLASFVSIILVAIFSFLDSNIHFTLRYAFLSTLLIYIEAIIIVVLSIPNGIISATLVFVCMIVLRSLMFITSVLSLFAVVFFKHNSLSTKELICMLWKDNKILLIIAFPYFLLWYMYSLYIMVVVLSNSNCTEDIQLQRAVWLVFNSLLRICEASFSASYFMKARMLFKETIFEIDFKLSETHDQEPEQTRRSLYIFASHAESSKPMPVGESIHHLDLEEQQTQNYSKSLCTEHLSPITTNVDASETLSQSTVTSWELHDVSQRVDSDQFLDAANYSSSDMLNVEVINAHAPVDTQYLIGEVEVGMFDERGGVFHSYKHGVTVIFPVGAIPSGILAELKFAATMISPVPFESNTVPFSAIFWLCMNVTLQKSIQLRLPLLNLRNTAGALQFAKCSHSAELNIIGDQMKTLEGEIIVDSECYGSIEVDHFCYYCITKNNLKQEDIPFNQYLLVAMKQRQPNLKDKSWSVHICLVPDLRTCDEYLKEQYNCNWEYKELTKFSFVDGCNELEIEFSSNDFGNSAKIDLSDVKIEQGDVDFHQYYSNGKLEELKNRMDQKEYPPRCKATVVAKHKNFFVKAHRKINVQCTCKANCSYKGKISIPCTNNEEDSSESDAELTHPRQQIKSSTTSGYISEQSDDDVDDFESKETAPGKPKLRKVVVLTSDVGKNWYKLGVALKIPFAKMEKFYMKYNANPMKALNRVYYYWLSDENNLSPTWEKLCSALREIKQFSIATDVEQFIELPSNDMEDSVFIRNDPNELALKNKVMKYIRLELLDMDMLVPLLNKYQLLTQANMYDLKNPLVAPTERANLLVYHILPSKGPGTFTLFVKCLQEEKEHLGHQTLTQLFSSPLHCENTAIITSKEAHL